MTASAADTPFFPLAGLIEKLPLQRFFNSQIFLPFFLPAALYTSIFLQEHGKFLFGILQPPLRFTVLARAVFRGLFGGRERIVLPVSADIIKFSGKLTLFCRAFLQLCL